MFWNQVFILIWTLEIIIDAGKIEQYFVIDNNKMTKPTSQVKPEKAFTLVACTGICLQSDWCSRASYNAEGHQCFLEHVEQNGCYSKFFGTETAMGWTVIEKKDSCDECYYPTSDDYSGNVNYTLSGRQCQHWDTNTPHMKSIEPSNSADRATNYCRDPDDEGTPWCYTMDPNYRFEFCPVAKCDSCLSPPVPPPGTRMIRNVTSDVMAAMYSCEDLVGEESVDHCPVSSCRDNNVWTPFNISCSVEDCYAKGTPYTGKVSCTLDGETCLQWNLAGKDMPPDPTDHETNYCRNFDGKDRPWCYIQNGWKFCHVPNC